VNLRAALACAWVVAWVLLVGALADFDDSRSRTAFALGMAALVPVFVAADWIIEGRRRG
jgi:hypothetical protein